MSTDVRDERAVREAVDRTIDTFGRIDIVAHNAGYALFGAVEETTDAEARALFDTNVFGVLNVLRAILPVLREQRSGHILQGSSLHAQLAHAGLGLLATTKMQSRESPTRLPQRSPRSASMSPSSSPDRRRQPSLPTCTSPLPSTPMTRPCVPCRRALAKRHPKRSPPRPPLPRRS
ncbi:SDR family NAD(P)-dependent oxidoreductase [Streptomyces sp. NPDC101171]|uniref:SDR family NAD(P)-dependent oxidoreductase n=1 Tax=Streptomyces sp. NPDC101171 TaxID=3366122 RepID=UPI00382DB099